ncbi:MAG: cation diffusion facilitator family transporter [Pseudomonadota bacterium]
MSNHSPRYLKIRFVTLIGAFVNLILAIIKMIVGYVGFSHALFVDGIHSLSDLLSDALVLYGAKQGDKNPDDDHPYGHARIETVFTVLFGFILLIVGLGIIIDSIGRLSQQGVTEIPSTLALLIALISVISKELLYQYTASFAHSLKSPLLKANAWHHRSDAISSVVVLIGVGGSIYGIAYLDIVAAVIVAMMIAKIGWDLIYEGVNELVDKGLEEKELERIKSLIETIPGVSEMHSLRTRQMGSKALVDVHIQVTPHVSVSEGHRISDEVSHRLIDEIEIVSQVLVHIDPEDDEAFSSCNELPLRDEVLKMLLAYLKNTLQQSDQEAVKQQQHDLLAGIIALLEQNNSVDLVLHYSNGKITVNIFLPREQVKQLDEIQQLECLLQGNVNTLKIIENIHFGFM